MGKMGTGKMGTEYHVPMKRWLISLIAFRFKASDLFKRVILP